MGDGFVWALWSVPLLAVVGVFVGNELRIRKKRRLEAEANAARDAVVWTLLSRIRADSDFVVSVSGLERYYNPKNNERVWWGGPAIAKGARAGDFESGVLVVTDKRVAFNYDDPSRADWSKTWATVARWDAPSRDRLVIEFTSGKPRDLRLPWSQETPAHHDARIASLLMERARGK